MKITIPQKYIRYCLMAILCYLIFKKYKIEYNLENCLISSLLCIVFNQLLFKNTEGFEDGPPVSEEYPEQEEQLPEEYPEQEEQLPEEYPEQEEQLPEEYPEQEEQLPEEYPDQEQSPEISEEIIEEIIEEDELNTLPEEHPKQEEQIQEEESEIKPYDSEELQKLQKKYTLMPVESWIKNEISLMQDSQKTESCSCPTLSRGSNDYLEF